MKRSSSFLVLKYIVWVTTLGLSLVTPLVLCVLGANWLRTRFALGIWIILLGIALGLGGAGVNLMKFLHFTEREAQHHDDEEDKP